MFRTLKVAALLAVAVAVVTQSASAGYTQEEVLRARLQRAEDKASKAEEAAREAKQETQKMRRELEALKGQGSLPAARQPINREQVSQIVQEEMQKIQGADTLRAFWDKGLRFKTLDGDFSLKVGGRVMVDFATMDADDMIQTHLGELEGDAEFRRTRFYMEGDIYGNTGYKLQIDFAGGDADLKDAYLEFADLLPFGKVKAGNFKEPFSLEELTSSKYITFMERALPVEAFSPSRNVGVQVANAVLDKRATWALGTFVAHDSDDDDATYQEGWNVTGRVTALPYYAEDGRRLVHLGAAGSYRSSPEMVRFRARPEVHLASERWVNTDKFAADSVSLCGLEGALVYGPFSLQSEYIKASPDLESSAGSDPDFDGAYVFASVFLTGEHRPYKTSSGSFSRVKPKNNFNTEEGTWGAWELAARYSKVDLNDADFEGSGELSNITLGLNWYLNPNMRIMWNYVRSSLEDRAVDTDGGDGYDELPFGMSGIDEEDADTFMMRLQVDF